jgi:hypothetical protein
LLLSGVRASLVLVQEAHGEPIEAAHFAAVRARVLAEIEGGRARRWRFAWMYAMAAAAVVLLVAGWPRPELHMVVPMPSPVAAPVVAKVVLPVALPRPRNVVAVAAKRVKELEPEPAESMVVKLLTNDPDVVIYWITGTKGE